MGDLYDAIPKVELHCHIEGPAATVIELARQGRPPAAVEDPEQLYSYTSLDTFLAIFWLVQETLTEPADWERIAYEATSTPRPTASLPRDVLHAGPAPRRRPGPGRDRRRADRRDRGGRGGHRACGRRSICDMDRAYGPRAGGSSSSRWPSSAGPAGPIA